VFQREIDRQFRSLLQSIVAKDTIGVTSDAYLNFSLSGIRHMGLTDFMIGIYEIWREIVHCPRWN
jgi:hypothetical protein